MGHHTPEYDEVIFAKTRKHRFINRFTPSHSLDKVIESSQIMENNLWKTVYKYKEKNSQKYLFRSLLPLTLT